MKAKRAVTRSQVLPAGRPYLNELAKAFYLAAWVCHIVLDLGHGILDLLDG